MIQSIFNYLTCKASIGSFDLFAISRFGNPKSRVVVSRSRNVELDASSSSSSFILQNTRPLAIAAALERERNGRGGGEEYGRGGREG